MKTATLLGTVVLVTVLGCSRQSPPEKAVVSVEERKPVQPAPVVKRKTVAGWIATYERGDAIERREAAAALGEIATHADRPSQPVSSKAGDDAVAALTKALTDRNAEVRLAAAHALGKAGPAARAANPALLKARDEDTDPSVREAAKRALEKISARPPGPNDIFNNIID